MPETWREGRKPQWLKVNLPRGGAFYRVTRILREHGLSTICEEAQCPNRTECFSQGTATFLILGKNCTRHCKYCNVTAGSPWPVDPTEPQRIVDAARELELIYVVITSVTRDDLSDGGAGHFAACITCLREQLPTCKIEVLIPDFGGDERALRRVIAARPDVINHNVEVPPRLFPRVRPEGDYRRSLELLEYLADGGITTKSGLMVGLGEEMGDIEEVFDDLVQVNCHWVTIGQYQQPTTAHWPVHRYYHPDEFTLLADKARAYGFDRVSSAPWVRSSYHAQTSGS